jgi:hypothetical protein
MTYKIIDTENYLLIVDDSKIKISDYYLHEQINKIFQCNETNNYLVQDRSYLKKIIAHLPLNNSPILEGVNLLPPLPMRLQAVGQTKIPVEFECEIGVCETWLMEECYSRFQCCGQPERIKTTTNSGGLTQWVGEYIY